LKDILRRITVFLNHQTILRVVLPIYRAKIIKFSL